MPKNEGRRARKTPRRRAAWIRTRSLATVITEEHGVTRVQAGELIAAAKADDGPVPDGCTDCDRCGVRVVEKFNPSVPAELADARQAARLHLLFCTGLPAR